MFANNNTLATLTAQDVPLYMRELIALDSSYRESPSMPLLRDVPPAVKTTEVHKSVARLNADIKKTNAEKTALSASPLPLKAEPSAQCNGCHCMRQIGDFVSKHIVYKSCARCRAKSASFYLEHKGDVNRSKYSCLDIFQCGCGSRVKMYCKRQHIRSERHKNWEMLHHSAQSTETEPAVRTGLQAT